MRIHQRHTTHQAASATSTRSARLSYSASRSRAGSRCAVTLMLAAALIFNALPLVSTTHAMNDAVRPTAASLDAQSKKHSAGATTSAQMASAQTAFGRLPVYFEENRGQASDEVKFIARGAFRN